MANATVYPTALARLKRTSEGYLWIVARCPLCGQRHTHGGGALTGDPCGLLTHRSAHCLVLPLPEPGGYILVEATEAP